MTTKTPDELRMLLKESDSPVPWRIAGDGRFLDRDGLPSTGGDCHLIVGAVNALPDLLDELDELRSALSDAADAFEECTGDYAQELASDDLVRWRRLAGEAPGG